MSEASSQATLLVVDDAPATVEVLQRNLQGAGYRVVTASGVAAALAVLEERPVDLVITDLKMPEISGLELVRHVRSNFPDTEVMMITGYATVEGAVEAVRSGAGDYLAKPFTEDELFTAVRRALDTLAARRCSATGGADTGLPGIVGASEGMRRVVRAAVRAARARTGVIVTGESGSGKERLARAIHYAGARAGGLFVPVRCAAIPRERFQAELIGSSGRHGPGPTPTLLSCAEGGTLFLDEVESLPRLLQDRLLDTLDQDAEPFPNGRPPDVRLVAATARDPSALVATGLLGEALYRRLAPTTISLPPLRQRGDDVLLLLQHFASRFSSELGRRPPQVAPAAIEAFLAYTWPGNVRELENLARDLVGAEDRAVIDVPDLPGPMRFSALRDRILDRSLADVEAEHIRAVLDRCAGNRTRAATILGISRKTLRDKLALREDTR